MNILSAFRGSILTTVLLCALSSPAAAQWLRYPTKGTPRTPDGKADLNAPAPKRADGKPNLTGVWMGTTKYMINIAADMKPEDMPFQPWAAAEYKRRRDTESKDDPSALCLPLSIPLKQTVTSPFKIVDAGDEIVVLFEGQRHREIFLDGRPLPKEPDQTWYGYSVGRWEGDTLVVESNGFNGKLWLDINGHPTTDALHIIERIRRVDFGHLSVEYTIDDPKAYTKPWIVKESPRLLPDTELLEAVCENNLDPAHMVGK